jgi:hypothetical protein
MAQDILFKKKELMAQDKYVQKMRKIRENIQITEKKRASELKEFMRTIEQEAAKLVMQEYFNKD